MPYREIGAFMVELRKREGVSPRALEFAILTATRSGEVFGATWAPRITPSSRRGADFSAPQVVIGLRNRLRKLEKRRRGPSPNRVLRYNPADLGDGPVSDDLPVWVSGYWRPGENPASGPLEAFSGRFALVPDFGTTAAWEAAAEQQQRDLLAKARSRTDEPTNVAPDSVGNSDSGDVPAPKRRGEKGKRFIELPDGRTFDRETGEFEGG